MVGLCCLLATMNPVDGLDFVRDGGLSPPAVVYLSVVLGKWSSHENQPFLS